MILAVAPPDRDPSEYRRSVLEGTEMSITAAVLRGDMRIARLYAADYALIRDELPTHAESAAATRAYLDHIRSTASDRRNHA